MIEIIVGISVGIALGMYISSQIKCHIRKSINNKELLKNINNEQKKRKN
jgi:uncharacterized protein YneF (UPF0154 family)